MRTRFEILAFLLLTIFVVNGVHAEQNQRDSRALDVLRNMNDYKASFNQLHIWGSASSDARLAAGLLIANTEEVEIYLARPGSLHFRRFDGIARKELTLNNGSLAVFDSETGFYATGDTPGDTDAALDFALEELHIDLPLMDLLKRDTFSQLVEPADEVLYLSENSRVSGVDCHHIVIRSAEVDVQLWIEEGDAPLPRRIIITDKWSGGAPRFVGNMAWDTNPDIPGDVFIFKPPEGSSRIDFVDTAVAGGN